MIEMCTREDGEALQRVFKEYYKGKKVEDRDFDYLNALTDSDYIEFYIEGNMLFARAGRFGKLFKIRNN